VPELSLLQPVTRTASAAQRSFHENFILRGKLGKGAFAQVHLAQCVDSGLEVAVKITDLRGPRPNPEKAEVDLRTKRSVEKEAGILRRIGMQAHCVRFYEDYQEGLLSYIVMERCDRTLLQALDRIPELTEHTLMRFIKEMLEALACIHSLQVVHRDVKPDNFLCSGERFSVQLCDFGLAEVLPAGNGDLKGVYGTAPFMSPEMLGCSGYGTATDVWSLGVIGYVILLGQFPYQPYESSAKAMKAAILAGTPVPAFKPRASLDMGWRMTPDALEFLKSTLDRNPAVRPSAEEALGYRWFSSAPQNNEQLRAPSLRPMLYAAKRAGAFDTRGVSNDEKGAVETMLASAQARYHGLPIGSPSHFDSKCRLSPSRVGRTHSDNSGGLGKAGLKDARPISPSRMDRTHSDNSGGLGKAGHKDASHASHVSTATGSSSGLSCQSRPSRAGYSRDA